METWLANNWFNLLAVIGILIGAAITHGKMVTKMEVVDTKAETALKLGETNSSELAKHRENTDRHRDPGRDGRQYDDLVKRLDRIEGKLDRLTEQA